jgi:hypothetical protein
MKKMFASLLLILLTSTFTHAQKYKYESREDGERIKTVIFANESSIKIEKNSSDGMASIVAIDKNQKIIYGLNEITDGHVNITAAYPNNLNAAVAIIETNCGGSMCSWNGVYAAYIYNNKLHVDFISNNHEKDFRVNIDITIQNNPKIIAVNAPENTFNKYGDMLKGTRELINGKGAIKSTFQRDWLVFVGKHPEEFFKDASKRETLAKSIGYDNFRTLRSYMTGPGSTTISDGKYLVMNGCMAHFCPNYYATLLIDTSSSKIWVLWVDSDKRLVKSGTNNKWEKEVARSIISLMEYNESLRIVYKDGVFTAMKVK